MTADTVRMFVRPRVLLAGMILNGVIGAAGCATTPNGSSPSRSSPPDVAPAERGPAGDARTRATDLFTPVSTRLHRVFTRLHDADDDGRMDGVEAFLGLQDRFGDWTKSSGTAVLDVYAFIPIAPDPRGERRGGPFVFDLSSVDAQKVHWDRTSQAYRFRLDVPDVRRGERLVVAASFAPPAGPRLFDRLVLDGG